MYPLDFEEFLWANDITEPVIALLQSSLDSGSPVPEALHNRMRQLCSNIPLWEECRMLSRPL